MIEINNLSKSFGKLKVLNSVNLSCKQGECIALIGPNGCGKTTLNQKHFRDGYPFWEQ
jgi:Cu-processing system ATP-binding protein